MCLQLTACRWVILLEQSSAVIFLWFLGFLVSGPTVLSLSFITCRTRYPVTPSCDTVLLPRATKLGFEFPSLVSYIPSALQCGCAGSCILANCLCFRRGKERRSSSGEKHVPGESFLWSMKKSGDCSLTELSPTLKQLFCFCACHAVFEHPTAADVCLLFVCWGRFEELILNPDARAFWLRLAWRKPWSQLPLWSSSIPGTCHNWHCVLSVVLWPFPVFIAGGFVLAEDVGFTQLWQFSVNLDPWRRCFREGSAPLCFVALWTIKLRKNNVDVAQLR